MDKSVMVQIAEYVAVAILVVVLIAVAFLYPVVALRTIQAIELTGDWNFRLVCGLITAVTYWLSERGRIKSLRWAQGLLLLIGGAALTLLIFTPSRGGQ